jgi:hypothetical protein
MKPTDMKLAFEELAEDLKKLDEDAKAALDGVLDEYNKMCAMIQKSVPPDKAISEQELKTGRDELLILLQEVRASVQEMEKLCSEQ